MAISTGRRYRGTSLRIGDRPAAWRRSVYGTLAAICTFYALASSRIALGESNEAVVLHFSLVALAALTLLALPKWRWPDSSNAVFLIGAGLGGGLEQLSMTRAYALHRAAPVTALSALGLVLTHVLAIPIFGERPSAWQVAGAILVIAASVCLALWPHRHPRRLRRTSTVSPTTPSSPAGT